MQFSIPHVTTAGLTATCTVEVQESVNTNSLASTIQTNSHFTNFKQGSESYPTMRGNIQGPGGITASGSNS